MWRVLAITLGALLGAGLVAQAVLAQSQPTQHPPMPMQHPAMQHPGMQGGQEHMAQMMAQMHGTPHMPGQDAFGAIAEVVRVLDADPKTDWSKVDLERLRQHLIDMSEVVLRSQVKQTTIAGGLVMEVTGTGRTEQAIQAMLPPHARELDQMAELSAKAEAIPGGARLTVTAKKADDQKAVARVRGLGFAGLLTLGVHHAPHHLAMAKGEAVAGHTH